jgi:hypothetical protein
LVAAPLASGRGPPRKINAYSRLLITCRTRGSSSSVTAVMCSPQAPKHGQILRLPAPGSCTRSMWALTAQLLRSGTMRLIFGIACVLTHKGAGPSTRGRPWARSRQLRPWRPGSKSSSSLPLDMWRKGDRVPVKAEPSRPQSVMPTVSVPADRRLSCLDREPNRRAPVVPVRNAQSSVGPRVVIHDENEFAHEQDNGEPDRGHQRPHQRHVQTTGPAALIRLGKAGVANAELDTDDESRQNRPAESAQRQTADLAELKDWVEASGRSSDRPRLAAAALPDPRQTLD